MDADESWYSIQNELKDTAQIIYWVSRFPFFILGHILAGKARSIMTFEI